MAGRHEVLTDRALQPFDHLSGIGLDDLRLFGIAFVGPTPAVVLHHRHRRRETPVDAGCRRFRSGRRADAPDQRRVARRAKADIVREQRRTDDIVVAMHRVGAPDDRHDRPPIAALHRRVVERVEELQPFRGRGEFVAVRRRIAAIQNRTEFVRLEVFWRDRGDIDLDQLANLILHAHPLQDRVHPRLDLRIAFQLHRQRRPQLWVRDSGRSRLLRQPLSCHHAGRQSAGGNDHRHTAGKRHSTSPDPVGLTCRAEASAVNRLGPRCMVSLS